MTYTGNSIAGGDGNVYNDTGTNWTTVKSLTSGTAQPTTDPVNVYSGAFGSAGQRSISRIFLPFDTSSIPAGSTINSATITINVSALPDGPSTGGTYHVVESTESNTSSLANGDFANIPGATSIMTSLGSLAISSTGSKIITLNATGLTKIIAGSITKLAIAEDHDVTNTDPGTSPFRISVNMSENATVGNRPLLTVTYTLATTTSTTTSTTTTSTSTSTTTTSTSTTHTTTSTSTSTSTTTTSTSTTITVTTTSTTTTSTSTTTTSTSTSTTTTSTSTSSSSSTSTTTTWLYAGEIPSTSTIPTGNIQEDTESMELNFTIERKTEQV